MVVRGGVVAIALALAHGAANAQAYPVKPIRMITPYAPGGGSDTLARILGQKLLEAWGQPVVVDNRPGGGGIIGAETVARAAPRRLHVSGHAQRRSHHQSAPLFEITLRPIQGLRAGQYGD